jgi:hypothetical protein
MSESEEEDLEMEEEVRSQETVIKIQDNETQGADLYISNGSSSKVIYNGLLTPPSEVSQWSEPLSQTDLLQIMTANRKTNLQVLHRINLNSFDFNVSRKDNIHSTLDSLVNLSQLDPVSNRKINSRVLSPSNLEKTQQNGFRTHSTRFKRRV